MLPTLIAGQIEHRDAAALRRGARQGVVVRRVGGAAASGSWRVRRLPAAAR
jgi:hypothetical protein